MMIPSHEIEKLIGGSHNDGNVIQEYESNVESFVNYTKNVYLPSLWSKSDPYHSLLGHMM